jgi:aminopeptidase-like protein
MSGLNEPSSIADVRQRLDADALGLELHERIRRMFPICRSITGNGLRETLRSVAAEIELVVHEVPSGTRVFDWVVPKEWNIVDACVKDRTGKRVIDFAASNLHVVNYSIPMRTTLTLSDLQPHLHSIPEHPDWIPYKTSYYKPDWGFCLSHRQREQLADGEYQVEIDSSLEDGHLTLGECFLPGRESSEVLFSCHVCHPSLCNDNLSGLTIAVSLAKLLSQVPHRYSYRFLFLPGTIGAITWLALNEARIAEVTHGLVLACLGDRGAVTYKRSRRGRADIDAIVEHVLARSGSAYEIQDFTPYGYDERQYCSPGFNLPVGVLSRTPYGRFAEYHTSADNLEFVSPQALADSLATLLAVVDVIEGNRTYTNAQPHCEPQLGRRGLYASMGGHGDSRAMEEALLWVLNFSDGGHSLLKIAERSHLPFDTIRRAAETLHQHELLT